MMSSLYSVRDSLWLLQTFLASSEQVIKVYVCRPGGELIGTSVEHCTPFLSVVFVSVQHSIERF